MANTFVSFVAPVSGLVLAFLCLFGLIERAHAVSTPETLVKNGSFEGVETLDTREASSSIEGWKLSGPVGGIGRVQVPGVAGGDALRIMVKPTGLVTLEQRVAVAPEQSLLFSAWVRSKGRVVARIGQASMSYHRQGQWQRLIGLIDTGVGSSLDIKFQLSSLDGRPVEVLLRDVVLRPAKAPGVRTARLRRGETTLVENGQPAATIVYPADRPEYEKLAVEVRDAVAKVIGIELPMVSDVRATEPEHPVLRPEYRDQNLILLGRLGINRALWPAYNRFLAASDGYYPGGDGYVVRTAANVHRDGYNHIILGGSSDMGAARATAKFIETIGDVNDNKDRQSLTLPWLLDVELGGACKEAFDQRDAIWKNDPLDPVLPKVEPGYGTVRRWYENAMGYYWSGRESDRRRAQEMIEPVLADMSYTHHYIVQFMVRAWDMLDDSDVYTDEQRAAMDTLIQKNFWEFLSGPDLRWMTTFSPPYDDIGLVNRHQTEPWAADLYMAEFIQDYFEPTGDLADLAAFRSSEKNAVMRYLIAERWAPSPPEGELTETLEESVNMSFRYAFDHEEYGFFDTDNARRSLHLARVNHRTGRLVRPGGMVDTHLVLGMLASYYQDGRYLTLLNELPMSIHPLGPFQGRYVNGVHRYTPGAELEPQSLEEFIGVLEPKMQPHTKSHLRWFESGLFKLPKIDPDDVFDFAAFRGGFAPDDDYFAINGVNASTSPGVILDFSSRDVSWLNQGGSSLFTPPSEQYFEQNAVHVLRTDRWRTEDDGYPAVAKREWVVAFGHDSGGVEISLEPFMGTRWTRQVLWIQSGLFIVRDTVAALSRGDYQVAVTWRPGGVPVWDGGVWISRSGGSELRITPLSEGFQTRQNVDEYLTGRADKVSFRQIASATLDADQAIGTASVLQALRPGKESAYEATQIAPDTIVLKPTSGDTKPIAVIWGPQTGNGLDTDAVVAILSADRVRLIEGSKLKINGKPVVSNSQKQSVSIKLEGAARQAVQSFLRRIATAPSIAADPSEEASAQVLSAEDRTADWVTDWTYEGLLRAGRVRDVRKISDEVVDLGRVVELDEVRARGGHRVWNPSPLPQPIWVAEPDASGQMPPLDSDAWHELDNEPQWHAGVKTGNYGGADPVDEDVQLMKTGGIKARYVRAAGAPSLVYYDRLQPEARRDLLLETADVDNDGSTSIFVKPDIWPKFIRTRWDQDDMVAMLDASGHERFQAESSTDYQSARLLDYLGTGARQAVLVNVNGEIDVLSPDGEQVRQLDLYEMHQEFNRVEGRPNTRHPAGGLTMPYSIGLWQRGSDGTASLIVGRYGALSFIDSQGNFAGVLMCGGYVTPAILSEGIDFNDDGVEEQLAISRGNLLQIGEDATPYVTEPNGSKFYPQIHSVKRLKEPAWTGAIDGARVLALEPFVWANTNRTVFVARDNYLGVYDGKLNTWAFEWVPLTRLVDAALAEAADNKIVIVAATADGLLWRLSWQGILNNKPKFSVQALADPVRRIAARDDHSGAIVIVGHEGLYLMNEPERLTMIARGSFTDAQFLSVNDTGQYSVVATTGDGKVVRFDPKP